MTQPLNRTKPLVMCVVGARPNFVKIGPILAAIHAEGRLGTLLVHTGQHYDASMNDSFFRDLSIPRPDVNLEVRSGSHAVQTAEIMKRVDGILDETRPDAVLVVGDVNSTLAVALVAAKKQISVIHVEAGLRSFDRAMPEEINRVLTDQISDLLFVTEREAVDNLVREGIASAKIHFVGNVMIDALRQHMAHAVPPSATFRANGAQQPPVYCVATLHRPSNVDDRQVLERLLDVFAEIGRELPVAFPIHPRTRQRIEAAGLTGRLDGRAILPLPPLGYLEMLGLVAKSALVLTDSGGLQEETTVLGVPCLTLRENTERRITVDQGTSTIVGNDPARIRASYAAFRAGHGKKGRVPELWDGQAAARIAAIIAVSLRTRS